MKNGNGKDYSNKHPDESKASEVASVLDIFKPMHMKLPKLGTPRKPLTTKEKDEFKRKYKGIIEPKFLDKN